MKNSAPKKLARLLRKSVDKIMNIRIPLIV